MSELTFVNVKGEPVDVGPKAQEHVINRVVDSVFGGWEVWLGGDLWMTVYASEVPRKPKRGDILLVRPPQAIGIKGAL